MVEVLNEQLTLMKNFLDTYSGRKPLAKIMSIIGPSGCGKTYITEKVAREYNYTIRVIPREGRDPTKSIIDALQTRNADNDKILIVIERGEKLTKTQIKSLLDKAILYVNPLIIHTTKKINLPYEKIHMIWQVQVGSLTKYQIQGYLKDLQEQSLIDNQDTFISAKTMAELIKSIDIFLLTGKTEVVSLENDTLKRDLQLIKSNQRVKKPLAQLNYQLINRVDVSQLEIVATSDLRSRHSEYWGQRILRYLVI